MTNIILCGCTGRMGEAVSRLISDSNGAKIVAGIDINTSSVAQFPIYQSISEFSGKADVIVDFSHHSALEGLVKYALDTSTPLVICTTGHTQEELALMREASKQVAVFFSGNMSIGINLITELCRQAARALGDGFDVEIIEKHHNKKLDAPSGTALMIANALSEERENTEYVYDRHNERRLRDPSEIGIHSVRGGTIVGEHEVIFAGNNETITISHTAMSREVFATGAVRAAMFLKGKPAGMYDMSNVINGK
ncbi:MAG: 4-hydroxy-tetrahydrodipicolinate reductase [Ruminococcaceae bacterium]|nr:4-hydroxy-tetrahydrodipicolinate reductase [Oscillospiraceae bacterium]